MSNNYYITLLVVNECFPVKNFFENKKIDELCVLHLFFSDDYIAGNNSGCQVSSVLSVLMIPVEVATASAARRQ